MGRLRLLNDAFVLVRTGVPLAPNQLCFHVPPRYTKPEIKAYLEQLYSQKVVAVNTVNYDKRETYDARRLQRRHTYSKAFKKAYVTFQGQLSDMTTEEHLRQTRSR